jgi:hypothetical protein
MLPRDSWSLFIVAAQGMSSGPRSELAEEGWRCCARASTPTTLLCDLTEFKWARVA